MTSLLSSGVSPLTASAQVEAQTSELEQVYSVVPQNTWGVGGLDEGSGNFRYFSPVFALEQLGNRVYAGGKFLTTTNGVSVGAQPYLASFNSDTGAWDQVFRPELDRSVFALATDGTRVFVGGEFKTVNGVASPALAVLNPVTGNSDSSFNLAVSSNDPSLTRVQTLEVSDGWLYIGGWFSSITGNNGVTHAVSHAARVRLSDGLVDPNWRPKVKGGAVWEIAPDAARNRVLLGGPFDGVGDLVSRAFAAVDLATGIGLAEGAAIGAKYFDEAQTDYDFAATIAVSGDRIVAGGQTHRLVIMDENLEALRVYTTNRYGSTNDGAGGDFQDIVISDNKIFASCHCWGRLLEHTPDLQQVGEPMDVRSLIAIDLPSGDLDLGFQPDFSGSAGPWALLSDDSGCLWVGTDAHQVGQRQGRGLVKFCKGTNLASSPSVVATMSSVLSGDSYGPQFLVDGNRVTNFPAASGTARSEAETLPYVDIDLGSNQTVSDVVIWNRTDGSATTRDISVMAVSESSYNGWLSVVGDPAVSQSVVTGDHTKKRTLTIPVNRYARYLRIQVDFSGARWGHGSLDFIEVAVMQATGPVAGQPTISTTVYSLEPGATLNRTPASRWLVVP